MSSYINSNYLNRLYVNTNNTDQNENPLIVRPQSNSREYHITNYSNRNYRNVNLTEDNIECSLEAKQLIYNSRLQSALFPKKTLTYTQEIKSQFRNPNNNYVNNWRIHQQPIKTCDISGFDEPYYKSKFHPMDWSKKEDFAIVLSNQLIIRSELTGKGAQLYRGIGVTSVKWNSSGSRILVGDAFHNVNPFFKLIEIDNESNRVVSKFKIGRTTGSTKLPMISMEGNEYLVASKKILHHVDTRSSSINTLNKYTQKPLSVAKIQSGYLTAIGFDGSVVITDLRRSNAAIQEFPHNTSVKTVKWHPNGKEILATGGGKGDGNIRFFVCNGKARKVCTLKNGDAKVCDITWFRDQGVVASYGEGSGGSLLSFWDLYHKKMHHIVKYSNSEDFSGTSLTMNPNNTLIACTSNDDYLDYFRLPEAAPLAVKKTANEHSKLSYYSIR